MIEHKYELNDLLQLKKPHPCKTSCYIWKVIRMGADIKIECTGCGAIVMLSRFELNRRIKKVLNKDENSSSD